MAMTESDLNLYLLMLQRTAIKSEISHKYKGGTDMRQKLEQFAIKAINKYHNEQ
jgi:hypothetical protein